MTGTTIDQLIDQLEELKMDLFDRESAFLRSITPEWQSDMEGHKMRRIAELRKQQELLGRTIKMLKEQN
jgi:hypothetical protein